MIQDSTAALLGNDLRLLTHVVMVESTLVAREHTVRCRCVCLSVDTKAGIRNVLKQDEPVSCALEEQEQLIYIPRMYRVAARNSCASF